MPLTQEELSRIATEAAQRAVAAATAAPAPTAAPAAPAAGEVVDWEARAKQAEAQNAVLQARVREAAGGGGGRRSMVANNAFAQGHGEGSQIRSLVQLARAEGRAVAVAEVSERFEKTFGADRFDATVGRSQIETALRSLVNAAVQDGLIKDPSDETAWG